MAVVYLNGEFVEEAEAHVSVNDRGFVFADGIYEVIRVFDGRPFELQPHLDRLARSAGAIGLTLDPSAEEIGRISHDLIARVGLAEAQLYVQVTRGVAKRDPAVPAGVRPTTFVAGKRSGQADSRKTAAVAYAVR